MARVNPPFVGPLPEFHRDTFRLPSVIKIEIARLSKNGVSKRAISRQLNVNRETVNLWVNRLATERNLETHNSSGASRKTTEEEDFLLICTGDFLWKGVLKSYIISNFQNSDIFFIAALNNFDNTIDIGAASGLADLSVRSLGRRLNANGLFSKIAAIKDILTEAHRASRLHFARQYVNMPLEFWRWVIFTDEKCWSSAAHGQIRVRRVEKERYKKSNIYSVKRSGRTTVTVWGGMWLGGLTPLYRCQENITAVQYVTNVLENTLLPYVNENFPQVEPVTFVQDK